MSQWPSTLVYVMEGVYHQVMNTGLNLAEAVNVGGVGGTTLRTPLLRVHAIIVRWSPFLLTLVLMPPCVSIRAGRMNALNRTALTSRALLQMPINTAEYTAEGQSVALHSPAHCARMFIPSRLSWHGTSEVGTRLAI